MRQEEYQIGPSPNDEDCAQVGTVGYYQQANEECRIYIAQLRRQFGEEPLGSRFFIKSNPHDFGTYVEVTFAYDDTDPKHCEYLEKVENGCDKWDDAARLELSKLETQNRN